MPPELDGDVPLRAFWRWLVGRAEGGDTNMRGTVSADRVQRNRIEARQRHSSVGTRSAMRVCCELLGHLRRFIFRQRCQFVRRFGMLMVTEVLGGAPGLMLAIARERLPAKLERHDDN